MSEVGWSSAARPTPSGRQPAASADTANDVSTPQVDERREGLNDARTHVGHAGADPTSATARLGQAEASRATATVGAPATSIAAQTYPTPIKDVTAAQAAPKAALAFAARAATCKAPTAGRRR